jgi:L-seryl-tRNA(Ser) seleniumtransferase
MTIDHVTKPSSGSGAVNRPPSVDALMALPEAEELARQHGRAATLGAIREYLENWRLKSTDHGKSPKKSAKEPFNSSACLFDCHARLEAASQASLKQVFNLTGTVLHTNLGRAVLAPEAIAAAVAAMQGFCNLEFDMDGGARGDRDSHVEGLLRELTGCEAATVVNNNAAAVLLTLAALAPRREVIVSRGELIEIGGAFRIPDIMRRAGCKLVEVGATNRTHLHDYESAIGPSTALAMKVHTSNYVVQGFTSSVSAVQLAPLCAAHGVAVVEDLGSGTLVDLTRWGLPAEPMPQQSLAAGVGVVTFSGDKLLGGPQAGLIVGRKDLIAKIKRHPLKRSLRCDKATLAALEATLRLYRDPDRLAERLPTLRMLTRTAQQLRPLANRLQPLLAAALGPGALVSVQPCKSQIGAGSLPVDRLDSICLAIAPFNDKVAQSATGGSGSKTKSSGAFCKRVATALRGLPVPVIGRIEDGQVKLDLRGLDGADAQERFVAQLGQLQIN